MTTWFDSLVSALVFAGFLLILRPVLTASLKASDTLTDDDTTGRDLP